MKYEIEIDGLPDGWEPIAFRGVKKGEDYWDEVEGGVRKATCDMTEYHYMVLEKKRWRAEKGGVYYTLWFSDDWDGMEASQSTDLRDDASNARYDSGNYFETYEQADSVRRQINQLLQDAHK